MLRHDLKVDRIGAFYRSLNHRYTADSMLCHIYSDLSKTYLA